MKRLVEDFQRDGYLLIPDALDESTCKSLRKAIDELDQEHSRARHRKEKRHIVHKAVFEQYPEISLEVFKNPKILPVVEALIGMCGTSRAPDRSLQVNVIHNNAFKVPVEGRGQAPKWHTDDPPLFRTADGSSLPKSVTVAPMVLTCMYYLNDVRGAVDGMTHLIPGSHRFGRPCSDEEVSRLEKEIIAPEVKEGTCLIISSSLWHRGAAVQPEGRERYLFQVSYGRRLVGHKHKTIMDYTLPQNVKDQLTAEADRELMGYLEGGAYS